MRAVVAGNAAAAKRFQPLTKRTDVLVGELSVPDEDYWRFRFPRAHKAGSTRFSLFIFSSRVAGPCSVLKEVSVCARQQLL